MRREICLNQVSASLKTGDLMLFHGKGQVSHLIELLEWSYWSHIGMVILPKDIGMAGEEPLFLESTSSGDGLMDYLTGAPKEGGVMLVKLSERVKVDLDRDFDNHFKVKYNTQVFSEELCKKLKAFMESVQTATFPSDKDLLTYYFEGRLKNIPLPGNQYFCSQLVAKAFMTLGFLAPDYVDNGYSPNDFDIFDNMPLTKAFLLYDGAQINKLG